LKKRVIVINDLWADALHVRRARNGRGERAILIWFVSAAVSMKLLWTALLISAAAVLALVLVLPGDTRLADRSSGAPVSGSPFSGHPGNVTDVMLTEVNGTGHEVKTALFSKYVAADTPYIIVSLYSGDAADPLSVTIITPDETLGPFYDDSDGSRDGRIDLKISNPNAMKPGYWKFLVQSRKDITCGNLENLSWIRASSH
jgi:hypothetical protein